MPSPQRPWRTRSPSRNWRSPGMTGAPAGAATASRPPSRRRGRRPRRGPAGERAGRRAGRERLALGGEVAAGRNGSPGGGRAGPAAPLPVRAAARRRRGSACRTGSSAAPRRRGRGRGRGRRRPPSRGPTISSAGISSRNRDGHGGLAHPPRRPAPGVREVQPALRPGDADVREPALLLELLLVVERAAVREEALLEAGDEDDRELEALGGVERDQRHRVGVALVRVLVGDERGLLEQPVERVVRRRGRRSGS